MLVLRPQDPSITSFWDEYNRCRKWIEDALEYAHNSHTSDQVYDLVKSGDAQLWSFNDSAIVTEIVEYPQRTVLRFWLAGGNLNTLLKAERHIVDWSKLYKCTGVEIIGRKGWQRMLKDYQSSSIVLVKEIK